MEPIMGIWSGFAAAGVAIPEDELGPYIQQAKDQANLQQANSEWAY